VEEEFNKIVSRKAPTVSYKQLFSRRFRSRMFVGMFLCFFQQFSVINAVLFYSDKIFKGDNPEKVTADDERMAKIFTLIIALLLTLAIWLSGKIIDKFGRKSMLVIGEALCISQLLILTVLGFMDQKSAS